MIVLPTEFDGRADQRGFHFRVLKRRGMVVLLEKTHPEHSRPHYEVCIVQITPERTFPDGRATLLRESLPGCEKWGMVAWSPATLEAAHQKFRRLSPQ